MRGRKSAAALDIGLPATIEPVERQRPPSDLSDEEVEIWAGVVSSMPADWFSSATVPLLAQYCRHVIQAKRIAELIEKATGEVDPETREPALKVKDYDRLLAMQARESLTISTLATKMRIAQQSTTNHRGNTVATAKRRPWEG